MSSTQLSFSIRTSSSVKTVHLLGSWDNYVGQLPLSKDKTASKSGSWKGTFRFQSTVLQPGQRYWYYYIIDGYHTTHNPNEEFTVEPTTSRSLNILNVGKSSKSKSSSSSSSKHSSSRSSRHSSSSKEKKSHKSDIPKGRPLSTSQIKAPKPMSPGATRNILNPDVCDEAAIEELTARFGSADIEEEMYYDDNVALPGSPVSSSGSSLSYRSESSSSLSGYSTPASDCSSCTCERYGITRKGERVRIDCGGVRCGFSDSEDCSSAEEEEYVPTSSRRNGIVVRA
ncbi:putative gtp-binding protein [Zalerion maritima]|uniref:Gtp-binding protein n=1 Tax=Zalerion maritima TaxID=339359 RepID=A0AAD5RR30_9PEZI|nr:putative gtp-binding protein [Zalerion maritima]